MTTFARFAPRLQAAIVARLGWSALRPVQEEAGAALLDGCNAVVLAPTAGGKTEAAIFPVLSLLLADQPQGVGAVYVAPIKALLNNQSERLGLYTDMVGLDRFVWHGDTNDAERQRFRREPVALLMTTPESLEVMLVSPRVDAAALFGDLRAVVVDEIHALAGTDRGAHLLSVLERIARLSRHDVQRVGLSATVGNPPEILGWLQGTSRRPGVVVHPPRPKARRELLVVHQPDRAALGRAAAKVARHGKSLFFCQSRATTESVAEELRRAGTTVHVHHSSVSKEERRLAEEQFHRGSDACIVCTSTLELGIDVGDLDRVLQADAPDTVSAFLQRLGRTGRRAGQTANTTFFCETEWAVLQAIALVDLAREGFVEDVPVRTRCWPVLVHQLLAMALAAGGVPPEEAWRHLSSLPDLSGIRREEFDALVAWMLADGALLLTSGRLVLGPKAERRFGRRNFAELYAVFSSPQTYTVTTAGGARALGSLNQDFVDRLVEQTSTFLLAGRAWAVQEVRHQDREVRVEPAPRGREPTWGGYLPQFLGEEVCRRIRDVLTDDRTFPWLHPSAERVLTELRHSFRGILEPGQGGVEFDETETRWWTFAGGRINSTLRHVLEAVRGGWTVAADNFALKLRGEDIGPAAFRDVRARLADDALWQDEKLWREVRELLPGYRLSKFQPLMPEWVEREVLATWLLDVAGTRRWIASTRAAAP